MCFLISFGPATFWLVIGYFVLFSSTKAEGNVQKFGKVLAIWIIIFAAFIPVMGAYLSLSGICPVSDILEAAGK